MFQCHSPKSSHPRPLPQSPKDCSIHLCLFCCLAYRVIITNFLNPYICIASAVAAKSLQLCPTLCDPIDGSPTGSPVPGILQARTLEWGAITFSNICISILYWCFSFWLTSLCIIGSSFVQLIRTDSNACFLMSE